ncbi:MAG: HlyC/CorC family transporter [Rhodobacteraceae bacterium]|nr:HlyC/CorC family transporter [Paracoccaceae bacterium]
MSAPIDNAFWIITAAVAALLVLSAFFSGSETALTAASRGKLRTQANKGSKGAVRALRITENNERLIGSVLLGNNLVNILATSLATALFTRMFGESGVALATLLMTLLVLIFAEVLPKTYAITLPEAVAARVAAPLQLVIVVFAPIVGAVRLLVRGLFRVFGVSIDPNYRILSVRDEIAGAIHLGHSEGVVHKEDRDRMLGVLDLVDRTVDEVMLHRLGIEMIDVAASPAEIFKQCVKSNHTRLPVFKDNPENIIGVVHAKDLLRAVHGLVSRPGAQISDLTQFDISKIAQKPYFVPDTTSLADQMREFLRRRSHFALVVDEYGSLQGLITLEDLLEEIVGEIKDEFDSDAEQTVVRTDDGGFLVDGATTLRDLNRAHGWALPDDAANTIAGLVIHEAQALPNAGQVFSFHGLRLEVLQREHNRITRLKIRPLPGGVDFGKEGRAPHKH